MCDTIQFQKQKEVNQSVIQSGLGNKKGGKERRNLFYLIEDTKRNEAKQRTILLVNELQVMFNWSIAQGISTVK